MAEQSGENDVAQSLDNFLASVERRAFKIALISTNNPEDALDLVQDSMMKLAQKYANKPSNEWPMLFQTILQSKIRDWYRRQKVRNQWRTFFGGKNDETDDDPIQEAADLTNNKPDDKFIQTQAMQQLESALQNLPLRQRQAFLLRTWEGLDVAETATVMQCSQGSVKTHYSRAIHTLRELLEDYQ